MLQRKKGWKSKEANRRKKNLKGMNIDNDFGYSVLLYSSLLNKEGRREGEWISKTCDQNSCLSDW